MRTPAVLVLAVVASVTLAGCPVVTPPSGAVGSAAADYLRGAGPITLEIDIVQGADPNSEALARLKEALRDVSGRQVDNVITAQIKGKGASHDYSFDELIEMHRQYRDRSPGSSGNVIHIIYVEGTIGSSGGGAIIGLAYGGSNVAISKKTIQDISCSADQELLGRCVNNQPRERNVERAVLVHEIGHILGLVNAGTPMVRDHEDPDNEGHSRFQDSVMWHGVETARGIGNIIDGGASIPHQFDEYDLEDLRALKTGGQ